jgi:VanZ family protein
MAITWTLAMGVACLVSVSGIPKVAVESADKGVHSIMHFGFTWLWLSYLNTTERVLKERLVLLVVIASLVFGICLEMAQEAFTTNRTAEIRDVMANTVGAIVAGVVWLIWKKKVT